MRIMDNKNCQVRSFIDYKTNISEKPKQINNNKEHWTTYLFSFRKLEIKFTLLMKTFIN